MGKVEQGCVVDDRNSGCTRGYVVDSGYRWKFVVVTAMNQDQSQLDPSDEADHQIERRAFFYW